MANKIKPIFGGLVASALVAGSALGQSVINAPVITKLERVEKPSGADITITVSNLTENARYYLYKSHDLSLNEWNRVSPIYRTDSSTNNLSKTYLEKNSNYLSRAFYLISTTNTPVFKREKKDQ